MNAAPQGSHQGSAAGIRPSTLNAPSMAGMRTDYLDDFASAVKSLKVKGAEELLMERLSSWNDGTMEALVQEIEDHPASKELASPPGVRELPQSTAAWLKKFGTVVLEHKGTGPIVVAVEVAVDKSAGKAASEFAQKLEDLFKYGLGQAPALGSIFHRIQFLLVSPPEHEQIKSFVANPQSRKDILQELDPERTASTMYFKILDKAIRRRASDIHIEPGRDGYMIRYRVDGVLQREGVNLPEKLGAALLNVFKIGARLDISEKRLPQSGGISFDLTEEGSKENRRKLVAAFGNDTMLKTLGEYSLRLECSPALRGEAIVVRLLKAAKETDYNLDTMGFEDGLLKRMRTLFKASKGVFILSGPTGSGKTTTLYSILRERNTGDTKIVTAENPVEVWVPGLTQHQTHEKVELTFARLMTSFVRQDPDIILVGETRDKETAKIAIEAANTGHLVFTTLHANNSVSVLSRLFELGTEPTQVVNSLLGVLSQRLVRKLCRDCIEPYDGRKDLQHFFERPDLFPINGSGGLNDPDAITLYRSKEFPKGECCKSCRGHGFLGRVVIPELWVIDRDTRDLILSGEKRTNAFTNLAMSKGMVPMRMCGLQTVLDGRTSLEELRDVIDPDEIIDCGPEMAAHLKQHGTKKK